MAFSSTITSKSVVGDKVMVIGTFTNTAGSIGGDIDTGLKRVDSLSLIQYGAAVTTGAPVVNETFPLTTAVTIVSDADVDGQYVAYGID